MTRSKAAVTLGLVMMIGAALGACSSSSEDAAPAVGAAFATQPPKTSAPSTLPIGAAQCSESSLADAAGTKYPGATIGDNQCTAAWAMATIFPAGGPKQGLAGFFSANGEGWALVSDASATGDVAAAAPPDFPPTLINAWKAGYVDPTKEVTTTTVNGGGGGYTGGASNCSADAASSCTTTTTAKPTTTTTAKSSSTTTQPSSPGPSSPPTSASTTTSHAPAIG